ncbi:uncharacterized protein LOC124111108 [Haliotis rufescens]|uniref:uncharacterized protein LOC124111108 n=1 Tax=Haliotis rufescens TaxID=6454 RepID=UPI00201F07A1|nr:uncharacterized protein LOC124111108 [Haliotis rufescens]XP_046326656.2 uncharacterized protein LOC124111108 [Haliotis rufescens]XP_046326657.2 uncharacterized protein LOC124111108 [Haliotis rufescens]
MATPGRLSIECTGEEEELSHIATSHSIRASPTLSSLPATHTGLESTQLAVDSPWLCVGSSHVDQVENPHPTSPQAPVVIKVVLNGDDVETVNVMRDGGDASVKLQVCGQSRGDKGKSNGTSDPDVSIYKSLSKLSMATVIKLIMLLQIIIFAPVCSVIILIAKGNVLNIHCNNVYNYHSPPLPANKTEQPVLDRTTGHGANKTEQPVLDRTTGHGANKTKQPVLDRTTGHGANKTEQPVSNSNSGNSNCRTDIAAAEGSLHHRSTPLESLEKSKTAPKNMIQAKQILPKPRSEDDNEDHCYWISSRTHARVKFAMAPLEYSCPDDQEEIDVKQLRKEQRGSTMTKDFTALAMQGDSSSRQEDKSVTGTGPHSLTQGLGKLERLIGPLLQVATVTVTLFIVTFAYAKALLQLLYALTQKLNCILDKWKQYVSTGRTIISSACFQLICCVVAKLFPTRVPPYFAMMLMMLMECSGSAHGECQDSFDSGAPASEGLRVRSDRERTQKQKEDTKLAGYILTIPNIQNVRSVDTKNTSPDESFVQDRCDDMDEVKQSNDPSDETENDHSSLADSKLLVNEMREVQDFGRGMFGDSSTEAGILNRRGFRDTEEPSACHDMRSGEVETRITSLPEDAHIIYSRDLPGKPQVLLSPGGYSFDDTVETDAGGNEKVEHVSDILFSQPGSRDLTPLLHSVKYKERDFEHPILPVDFQLDERLHMPPKRKYIWPHYHCIHGEMYDMMNFALGIESALDGTGVFLQASPLHVENGNISTWRVKSLSVTRTAYFDHMAEAPYIEEKVEIETFLQIRRQYEIYISHQDDDPDKLKIYGLKKSVEFDQHFVRIFYQCREAIGSITVFVTFQPWSGRRFNQSHQMPSGQTLKSVMAHPAIHNFVCQLKQVYTRLQGGCYVRLTMEGCHVYPSPSWRVNHSCILEIAPSVPHISL